jgi:hypothetical protein
LKSTTLFVSFSNRLTIKSASVLQQERKSEKNTFQEQRFKKKNIYQFFENAISEERTTMQIQA